ncbi:hypothetical protein M1555_02535 [Patescibacteria group bacterium]|nr:hypothetical protein [Patescibacteria group bacterium]
MNGVNVVTVAGHQLSWKDALRPVFAAHNYHLITFSDMARDIATAWGKDRNNNQDKIDVGISFKEMFGDDILVRLAILKSAETGYTKLVLFGPRRPKEAVGNVIFVTLNPDDSARDYEMRRRRAEARALLDSSRSGDVESFQSREEQEHALLEEIRNFATITLQNDSTMEAFLVQAERMIAVLD